MEQFDPKADCALWVIIQTVHNNVPMGHCDTNRADCAKKTLGPWIITLTVRNNNLKDQVAPKS